MRGVNEKITFKMKVGVVMDGGSCNNSVVVSFIVIVL